MSGNRSNIELLTILLTLLFIGLKLTNYIDWSWWLALSVFGIFLFFRKRKE